MGEMQMADLIQLRRDTAANWTTVNPILRAGEVGYETDTKREKRGDGITAWNSLDYFNVAFGSDVANVKMNGTAALGDITEAARVDHVHPRDSTLAPSVSPAFTGAPTAPTAAVGNNTTQIATTAFVQSEVSELDDFHAYDATRAYAINEPTFYLGVPYKSIFVGANTGNTPSTSPTYWEVTGGGSGSATNVGYNFANGQFETHTIGWSRYADAAGVIPVDGTGGSPNASTTFLRNTTTPINGLGDAILSKDAANRRGEGVSYDFTIDRGQTTSPAQITFAYKTPVAYLDGYLGAFLYDKTNGALIRMSVENIPATYGSISQFLTTFIPSTSTEYRLIFHVIDATSTAWTFEVDNIQVGQKNVAVGAAIGNWIDYTPSGNITNLPGAWTLSKLERVGASAHIIARYTASGPATSYIMIPIQNVLPAGITAAPTKYALKCYFTAYQSLGLWDADQAGSVYALPGASSAWNQTIPSTWANGSVIEFDFSVPIAQWTSNVNMASDFTEYGSDDAGTDVFGPSGCLVPNIVAGTGVTSLSFTFPKSWQVTDLPLLEFANGATGTQWAPHRFVYIEGQNNFVFGAALIPTDTAGSRVCTIQFGNGGVNLVNGLGAAGNGPWSVVRSLGFRWRVRKVSNGNMAEVPNNLLQRDDGVRTKVKKLTGTTYSAQTGETALLHGLDSTRIISASGLVFYSTGSSIPHGYAGAPGYEFSISIGPTLVLLVNTTGNSANILSKPFIILITYED